MDARIRKLLFDIEEAGAAIKRFIEFKSLVEYEQEEILRAAVERKFEIIGEALNRIQRIDEEIVEQIYEYRRIIGFRNILAHGYDAISNEIVWEICGEDLTHLLEDVHRLLNL